MALKYDWRINRERLRELKAAHAAAWQSGKYPVFRLTSTSRYLIDVHGVISTRRFPKEPPTEIAINLAEYFMKDAVRVKHPMASLSEVATIARRRLGPNIDLGAMLLAAKRLEFPITTQNFPSGCVGVSLKWLHEQPEAGIPDRFSRDLVLEPEDDLVYAS